MFFYRTYVIYLPNKQLPKTEASAKLRNYTCYYKYTLCIVTLNLLVRPLKVKQVDWKVKVFIASLTIPLNHLAVRLKNDLRG